MSDSPPDPIQIDGADFFIGIVAARYNSELVDSLVDRTVKVLTQHGVRERNIEILRVPGSNEIPYAAHMLAATGGFDCLIALGVILAGETSHHEVISYGTAYSLHSIGMQSEIPVINGILTVNSLEQARERIGAPRDRGAEFARAALQMAWHKLKLVERLDELEEQEDVLGEEDDDDDDEGFDPKQLFKNN
ncbi:MAG TPA: 6,7-dimethyl-8-ribityllumazine synthase [Opitutales bacterium]|jgi:6,7-dimethyl-8-ribityllumazine synthase|nr:6,7-dimethyl-8-ribityllumazine synthase [Opitutales bacterium]